MCLSGLSFHSVCHYHPLSTPLISTTLVPHQFLLHYTTWLSTSNNDHITLPFYTITPSPSFSHPVTHLHLHDCPSCNHITTTSYFCHVTFHSIFIINQNES